MRMWVEKILIRGFVNSRITVKYIVDIVYRNVYFQYHGVQIHIISGYDEIIVRL